MGAMENLRMVNIADLDVTLSCSVAVCSYLPPAQEPEKDMSAAATPSLAHTSNFAFSAYRSFSVFLLFRHFAHSRLNIFVVACLCFCLHSCNISL